MLVDRGARPVAPVATYWPEFAAERQAGHRGPPSAVAHLGRLGLGQPFAIEDIYDWDKSTSQLAAQAPWWEPGTASGYHALNYGHLIGEVIRRITGKTLKEFVRDEIAGPAGRRLPDRRPTPEDDHRIAELVPPPPLDLPTRRAARRPPDAQDVRGVPAPDADGARSPRPTAWRRADIGGANGHGNARALARALSPISLGGKANGVQLLARTPST